MTPSTSPNSGGVTRAANFKKAKDRLTLLACANASGSHCLPLTFINKSSKPRCIKHMDMNSLPVNFYSQKKLWMDCTIFKEWFHQRFVPSVRRYCSEKGLEKKALLLLDNAPSHPSTETLQSDDGKIKTMCLPPNTTAAIQPMDQTVLDLYKHRYKRKLLASIILEDESTDKSVLEILKSITIKDAAYWIAAAWEEASCDSLHKTWRNLLPQSEPDESSKNSENDSTDLISDMTEIAAPLEEVIQHNLADWMQADNNDPGREILDDNEIVEDMMVECGDGDCDEQSSDEESSISRITACEAFHALDTTMSWLEQTGVDSTHVLQVKKWHDEAARMRHWAKKQTSISSYFSSN